MRFDKIKSQVNAVLSTKVKENLKFIYGQNKVQNHSIPFGNSEKPLFTKNLRTLFLEYPEYNNFNVILVDDSPYKTSLNGFYSSLYVPSFKIGQDDHDFLLNDLMPYVTELASFGSEKISLQTLNKNRYPIFSAQILMQDYDRNQKFWEHSAIQLYGDVTHLKRYRRHRENANLVGFLQHCLFLISYL